LRLCAPNGGDELSFFGTVATFGLAAEVTTSELSIESFFPANDGQHNARAVRRVLRPAVRSLCDRENSPHRATS
jgi:hypothetical protein